MRARFGRILAAMRFLLFAPREGACSADGLARCGGELYCLHSFEFWAPRLSFDPRAARQIGKFGSNLESRGFFIAHPDNAGSPISPQARHSPQTCALP